MPEGPRPSAHQAAKPRRLLPAPAPAPASCLQCSSLFKTSRISQADCNKTISVGEVHVGQRQRGLINSFTSAKEQSGRISPSAYVSTRRLQYRRFVAEN